MLIKIIHSSELWLSVDDENKPMFHILSELALIFSCIPSSSAAIERYFSICGCVIKKNAGNHRVDLFFARCMIKCNMEIIKNMKAFDY